MRRALLCLGLLAALPAAGQEAPADEIQGEVVFGPQYYADSDNRDCKKCEEYRDVPNGLVLELLDIHWTPIPKTFFNLAVRDVTQRDQKILFEVGRQDLWRGTVHWSENPREWTDQAFQLFAPTGP